MRDLATGARAIATKAREASASGALRSSAQSLGLRIIGLVSTFGLGVILARALGPAEFGVYGLVIAIATVVGTVALVGTPQLAVREISVRIPLKDWTGVKSLLVGFAVVALAVSALAVIALHNLGAQSGRHAVPLPSCPSIVEGLQSLSDVLQ